MNIERPVLSEEEQARLSRFWGKFRPKAEDATSFHPLLCHMLDVAAVAEALWRDVLSAPARRALTAQLGLEDERAAGVWVAFLAGLHDTGKCSPAFALRQSAAKLAHLYTDCTPNPGQSDPKQAPHGQVTALTLREILKQRFGLPGPTAHELAVAIGGHHGVFPSDLALADLRMKPRAVGQGCWQRSRVGIVLRLAELLGAGDVAAPRQTTRAAAITLAGLVSVADWIGSIDSFFPYLLADDREIPAIGADYLARTRRQAETALRALHWTGWTPGSERRSFPEMFEGKQPRPLQQAALALAQRLSGPGLVVIEAPMGEGKTEAALYLADRWNLDAGARGLYFALPTQATSNQMFGRLEKFLAHRYPTAIVNLQLLHGLADLRADFAELQERDALIPRLTPDEGSVEAAGVIAGSWFAQRKRGLLAPFGVGTVDQALLAVLQVMHVFVRLYGLANRAVVIDEVHAYDTYMTALIERLLEWLAALGSPVVLLSATLPRARRDCLLQAYARGLGVETNGTGELRASYPRMSWALPAATGAVELGDERLTPAAPARPLQLLWVDGQLPQPEEADFALGLKLQKTLADGGCAAVICNTVARAQAVYRALQRYFPGEASDGLPQLDLFHARFLHKDRAQREARTLTRFGPESEWRPWRAVLVATQVIEQSLDLDFDLMLTDFAPADLLLQRAGRLWRHQRARPAAISAPALWVCLPPRDEEGLPSFPGGDAPIYDTHVLFRSWLALRGCETVTIPDDIEPLVEAVYRDGTPLADLTDGERLRWQSTLERLEKAREAERQEAEKRWLPAPAQDLELARITAGALSEDAPDLHPTFQALTRLSGPSVTAVFLHGDAERPALEPGAAGISLSARPDAELTRELLARSVNLQSPRGLVFSLIDTGQTPSGWQRSPHLRHARLIVLDANGAAEHEGYRIRLDEDLGVVAEKIPRPDAR